MIHWLYDDDGDGSEFSSYADAITQAWRNKMGNGRDPARISIILSAIEDAWRRNPDMRLMQLLGNLFYDDGYHVEEEHLLRRLIDVYEVPDPRKDHATP